MDQDLQVRLFLSILNKTINIFTIRSSISLNQSIKVFQIFYRNKGCKNNREVNTNLPTQPMFFTVIIKKEAIPDIGHSQHHQIDSQNQKLQVSVSRRRKNTGQSNPTIENGIK